MKFKKKDRVKVVSDNSNCSERIKKLIGEKGTVYDSGKALIAVRLDCYENGRIGLFSPEELEVIK